MNENQSSFQLLRVGVDKKNTHLVVYKLRMFNSIIWIITSFLVEQQFDVDSLSII